METVEIFRGIPKFIKIENLFSQVPKFMKTVKISLWISLA